jgi:hypothetical protein
MIQIKCTHPGCTWHTEKPNAPKANLALKLHIGRKHGGVSEPSAVEKATAPSPEQPKRQRQQAASVTVNFCPNCGCDIHRVAVGMVMASRLKH